MVGIFEIIGAAGLVLVTIGVLVKKRKTQDIFFIFGGICLEIYSIWIQNLIFIILQLIFTIAAVYDFIKLQLKRQY